MWTKKTRERAENLLCKSSLVNENWDILIEVINAKLIYDFHSVRMGNYSAPCEMCRWHRRRRRLITGSPRGAIVESSSPPLLDPLALLWL